ncbi:uncharacterized protein [Erythrolamprus reginae]|uniref:uncharacterized protein n=1 Tax=Erythrolamprus reginae TaxID=121349 RepID=UPI00396C97A3
MSEEFKMGPSSSVQKDEPQKICAGKNTRRLTYKSTTRKTFETTGLMYLAPEEQKLWEQILEVLSPYYWVVKVSGAPQNNPLVIYFTGSSEVVLRAKAAINKLLIFVRFQIQINQMDFLSFKVAGFFQIQDGLHLFLWEGEPSHIRADAQIRLEISSGLDYGNAVIAQRAWSPERSLYTNLDIQFSCPPTTELAAAMIKLALEAASRKGFQSVIITYSGPTMSKTQSEVIVVAMEEFRKKHLLGPLKTVHVIFEYGFATFYNECQKHWSPGKDDSEKLRTMLLTQNSTKIEIVTSPDIKKKADVVVVPLLVDPHGLDLGSGIHAISQKALKTVPQCLDLYPENILPVPGSAFPEFDCRMIYLARLDDDLQWKPKKALKKAIRNMIHSCLSTLYGSFLESIVFPILLPEGGSEAAMQEWLLFFMEEINQFLKNFPNTWIQLVQIRSFPGWVLPCPIEDSLSFPAEPVGLCHMEEPLFLQYLKEKPTAFNEFQEQVKKTGYDIQIDLDRRLCIFQAINQFVKLPDLEKAFGFVRKKYVLHCETRAEILDVLIDYQTPIKGFESIKIYTLAQTWFVGLLDEINWFLQCLANKAFERELISWEFTAKPLPRYTIAKDVVLQELPLSNSMVKLEISAMTPATIRFWGPRQKVRETERRLKELLNTFKILPVRLSNFQLQFVKAHWDEAFHSHFFLERNIPVVLELSQVVQIAGLDLDNMKEAKEILMELVCERAIEIAEDVKWATECSEWKLLLKQSLETHKEVAIYHMAPDPVILVGFCPMIIQVEESIKEYLRENSPMEENVSLTKPELALAGKDLLHIMGWEHLNTNVALQVNSQPSVLQVKGPQKYVQKAMPAIKRALDSLVLDVIPLRRRIVREYICRIGASLVKDMARNLHCIAGMKTEESDNWKNVMDEDSIKERFDTSFPEVIYIIGKWNHVAMLKPIVAGLLTQICTKSICHEAIATFKNMDTDEFLRNNFSVDIRWLQNNEIQICGFQKDVKNVLEAVQRKIEEYESEIIEVKAQFESVPYTVIKESFFQKRFPTSPFVNIEILADDPATIIFKGPRQKSVDLRRHFEELLSGFHFFPVPLSKIQFQFVKAKWGKLFHEGFFGERNISAILEVSAIVQIGSLSLSETKVAEKILMEQVCEKTVKIENQLQWVIKEPEWEDLLKRLNSHKEVAVYSIPSNQVIVVGPSPLITRVVEGIKGFLRSNFTLEENIMLTKPELVLVGESVLRIMNWESLKVDITFKQSNSTFSLQVKGHWKFVKEAIPVIKKDLDSLKFGMIPVKKKALCIYFSEDGAELLKNMAETQNCIVKMQTHGRDLQDLSENHRAVIHVAGIQMKVNSIEQHLSDFIAKFHKETISNAEISTFSDIRLKALCATVSLQYPVCLHRHREKMIWICGSQEDVKNVSDEVYTELEKHFVAKIQEAEAEQTRSRLLFETIGWHYKSDAGWSTFDILTNYHLEQAYSTKQMATNVQWNGENLLVNFLKCEGFIAGRTKLMLKREIYLWDKNIAPFWEAMDGCLSKRVELHKYSAEYRDVMLNFKKTAGKYNIVKIERIQNRYLWISYCWKKTWMEKRNPEGTENELILFHGTKMENCSSVCDIGFKKFFRKQCLYGQGIYFAVAAGQSASYAQPDSEGLQYVFQARVLTGEYACGKQNMFLPPMKENGNDHYDSLVDIVSRPNIFVIFFDDHAYPEYLITFRS